jgi:hypothetical protein
MPHWISDWILSIINVVPALFVDKDDPNFMLARAMFALLFIVLVVFIIAMRPIRTVVANLFGWSSTRRGNGDRSPP